MLKQNIGFLTIRLVALLFGTVSLPTGVTALLLRRADAVGAAVGGITGADVISFV
jgi:hypothetical protein